MKYEIIACWDGELFVHHASTFEEAMQWAHAYAGTKNCKARVWRVA